MLTAESALAVNRFGLGARPGDARLIGRDHEGWLLAQLEHAAPADSGDAPSTSATTLRELNELRVASRRARNAEDRQTDAAQDAARQYRQFIGSQYREQLVQRYERALSTERPFVERLVHFWSNHFAVSADKQPIAALAGSYEHEAIRPHVTGNFLEMLVAVERHPAMIIYLDNQASAGPDSMLARAALRNRGRELGLNENLAREILELHTLGVDGGYDQDDVTEFAKVLTGWSVGGEFGRRGGGQAGEFHFRTAMHEPGVKTVLDQSYKDRGVAEGEAVLEDLALHPATASHVATKLARHFVADDPPPRLVSRLANTYLNAGGELLPVYRELIESEETWRTPHAKYKTPQDFVISAYRALNHVPENLERFTGFLTLLGQRPLTPGSPAGWPDVAQHWDGGDALLKRIEWATAIGRTVGDRIDPVALADAILGPAISEHTLASIARAESASQGLGLLLASPEFQRR